MTGEARYSDVGKDKKSSGHGSGNGGGYGGGYGGSGYGGSSSGYGGGYGGSGYGNSSSGSRSGGYGSSSGGNSEYDRRGREDRRDDRRGRGGSDDGNSRAADNAKRFAKTELIGKTFNIQTHQGKSRDGQCRMMSLGGSMIIMDKGAQTLQTPPVSGEFVSGGEDNGNRECYVCGKLGHLRWECPLGREWHRQGLCDERYVVCDKHRLG